MQNHLAFVVDINLPGSGQYVADIESEVRTAQQGVESK
jgi:hypothetical protein